MNIPDQISKALLHCGEQDIPIDDQNFSAAFSEFILTDTRRNGNIVEQTKPHSLVVFCMVPRRPNNSYGILNLASGYS